VSQEYDLFSLIETQQTEKFVFMLLSEFFVCASKFSHVRDF